MSIKVSEPPTQTFLGLSQVPPQEEERGEERVTSLERLRVRLKVSKTVSEI